MNLSLNRDFLLIGDLDTQDIVILKHKTSHRVFKLSSIEYRIIELYTKGYSKTDIIDHFADDFEISLSVLDSIIDTATKHSFIIVLNRMDYGAFQKNQRNFVALLNYIIFLVLKRLNINPRYIQLDSTSSFNLTKVLKWTPKPFAISVIKALSAFIYVFFAAGVMLFAFYGYKHLDLNFTLYSLGNIGYLSMLLVAFPISLLISFMHEFSHYTLYKKFGGIQNEIGLGLLYGFIPIFYTTTEDMIIWKKRGPKIQVALAGIMNDLLFLSILLSVFHLISSPWLAGICSFLILNLIVKLFYNANPFSPGSDMYFTVIDLFNLRVSFTDAHEMLKEAIKNRTWKINIWKAIYALFCYLSIICYFASFLLIITFPLWIKYAI
ncbi:MAG: hypothetical protein ACTHY9_06655 [Sphingobacterium sp.]